MNTVVIWLLISVGTTWSRGGTPTTTVERFATWQECERVAEVIRKDKQSAPMLHCIEARVIVMK